MRIIIIYTILLQITLCTSREEILKIDSNYCINSSEKAVEEAEKKWLEIYGESIYDKKPFCSRLINDTIWVIEGTISKGKAGGVPYAEINAKNCQFIIISHSK